MRGKKSSLLEGQDVLLDCVLTNDLSQALPAPGRVSLKASGGLQLFERGSSAPFSWPLWMVWVQTTFWHSHPVRFSSAEGQPERCCFCFTKLSSFVKNRHWVSCWSRSKQDCSLWHCVAAWGGKKGKRHSCNFSWGKDKIQPSLFIRPFQAVTVLSQLRWQEAILHSDEHVSLFSSQLSPQHYAYGREREKRKKQKRHDWIEMWICA